MVPTGSVVVGASVAVGVSGRVSGAGLVESVVAAAGAVDDVEEPVTSVPVFLDEVDDPEPAATPSSSSLPPHPAARTRTRKDEAIHHLRLPFDTVDTHSRYRPRHRSGRRNHLLRR